MARLSVDETVAGLEVLRAPDPYSRTKEYEGRRIEDVDGGWIVLNHAKWRAKMSLDERREYLAIKQRESRARRSKCQQNVNKRQQMSTLSTDTDTDTVPPNPLKGEALSAPSSLLVSGKPIKNRRCTQKEAEDFCKSIGLPKSDGAAMFLHWEEKGWAKIKDWQLTIRKWQSFGYLPSQKAKPQERSFRQSKALNPSKIALAPEFRDWALASYPAKRDEIETWRTWSDVPVFYRTEWKREAIKPLIEKAGG
jgi:hypothetical protein